VQPTRVIEQQFRRTDMQEYRRQGRYYAVGGRCRGVVRESVGKIGRCEREKIFLMEHGVLAIIRLHRGTSRSEICPRRKSHNACRLGAPGIAQPESERENEIPACGVARECDGGCRHSRSKQPLVSREHVVERCGEGMFRGQPVISTENSTLGVARKGGCNRPVSGRRTGNEPAAMQVQDDAWPSRGRHQPFTPYPSDAHEFPSQPEHHEPLERTRCTKETPRSAGQSVTTPPIMAAQ
jgi:hypothetical protein